jgi:hypothetical protein
VDDEADDAYWAGEPLPTLDFLVSAAESGLAGWVLDHVGRTQRRLALRDDLSFWLETAAKDPEFAAGFAAHAPVRLDLPAEAYRNRWLALRSGAHVLVGPRYLGRDPDLPFVGISASERLLTADDVDDLIALARSRFAPFAPEFLLLNSAWPITAWPGCRSERRTVVGTCGALRRQPVSSRLRTRKQPSDASYDGYRAIYDRDQAADPIRRRWARTEDREDFVRLGAAGTLFDVLVDGQWAGIVAAKEGSNGALSGAVVQELTLDQRFRGQGLGHQLSGLLARALPYDDDHLLIGTIHSDNVAAYRSALRAGRVDVGGEILIPIPH